MKRKIAIAGKNNIAVESLKYILENYGNQIEVMVICNKTETGVDSWQHSLRNAAQKRGIAECKLEDLYSLDNLVFLSLEYDRLIKPEKFKSKELYNLHFSLLPKYRGMYTSALPILNGEKYSGVTLHCIDEGIDTGDIIAQKKFKLTQEETSRSLYLKYIDAGTSLIKENLKKLIFIPHEIQTIRQNKRHASYYSKNSIDYARLEIDLNQTAFSVDCQIRAFSFREYQMPKVNGRTIIASKITDRKSQYKPGTIIVESDIGCILSTIDYDLIVYYDRLNELIEACENGDINMVKKLCAVREHVSGVDIKGRTPLIAAKEHGYIEIENYLLCCGA